MDKAFDYVEQNPLELESNYQYIGRKHLFGCEAKKGKEVGTVKTYKDITSSASQL